MTTQTFGEYLRAIRENKEITLRALAEAAEMDPAYLSRLENGKSGLPKQETVEKLALALCAKQQLGRDDCDRLKRQLLVKSGHLQDQEGLIDDLAERFADRLRDAGFPEDNIDEALAKVSLSTMRSVLLGEEKLEIGNAMSYSSDQIDARQAAGEEVHQIQADLIPRALSTVVHNSIADRADESPMGYIESHAEEFTSRRRQRRLAEDQNQQRIIRAGADANIHIHKNISKQQERQIRLIAKLITTIIEEK